jgi:nonsense-mediated mRNA decay protein 3
MVDAGFIWTEPHSRRIKVKVTIQKEVMGGAILQQVFVVEFVVNHQMCEDCHRREAKDTWNAVVQLRQKVRHKKTFYYLEQLIIKHRAQKECVNILGLSDGVDFYFSSRSHAKRLVDFLSGLTPMQMKTSERLISAGGTCFLFVFRAVRAKSCIDARMLIAVHVLPR